MFFIFFVSSSSRPFFFSLSPLPHSFFLSVFLSLSHSFIPSLHPSLFLSFVHPPPVHPIPLSSHSFFLSSFIPSVLPSVYPNIHLLVVPLFVSSTFPSPSASIHPSIHHFFIFLYSLLRSTFFLSSILSIFKRSIHPQFHPSFSSLPSPSITPLSSFLLSYILLSFLPSVHLLPKLET